MNNPLSGPEDERLRGLLRESRPSPNLSPGFQESVWRRLERTESHCQPTGWAAWLEEVAGRLLRPRWALAGIATSLLVGVSIGVVQGNSLAGDLAKQHYLRAVSPHAVRQSP